ncbi:MAG: helix-turn-helix transcriptional regulator [Deltaproteobacteria bacterium]|nr:helix-turn-helix transcriptional regulator [Deltaproteobacteria bacterium]
MGKKKVRIIEEDGCQIRVVHLDRVKKARSEAIPPRELDRLSLTFKVLGDVSRLKIALALQAGEMCVCDLAAYLNLSESAISHQLRHLKDLALVKARRDGQILYYSLDDDHVGDLFRIGLDHVRE